MPLRSLPDVPSYPTVQTSEDGYIWRVRLQYRHKTISLMSDIQDFYDTLLRERLKAGGHKPSVVYQITEQTLRGEEHESM